MQLLLEPSGRLRARACTRTFADRVNKPDAVDLDYNLPVRRLMEMIISLLSPRKRSESNFGRQSCLPQSDYFSKVQRKEQSSAAFFLAPPQRLGSRSKFCDCSHCLRTKALPAAAAADGRQLKPRFQENSFREALLAQQSGGVDKAYGN